MTAGVHLFLLALLFCHASGVSFTTAPIDTCVLSGQSAQFNCRTEAQTGSVTLAAGQEWTITTPGAGSVTYYAASVSTLPVLPAAYEWIVDNSGAGFLTGLRVVSADSSLNGATFQCIAIFAGERDASAPAATLEVAGPPGLFSCSVTCPPMPFVSGQSDKCIVQWTRPQTALCAPITSYTVAIATGIPGVDVAASTFTRETTALEPFTTYTVSVTATDELGMISTCLVVFTTSREDPPVEFTLQLQLLTLQQTATFSISPTVPPPPRVATYSVAITDVTGQQVGAVRTFQGSSSSLSLDISSLPQCMSYTVSVTANNTGGSTITNATLFLDPLTSLEVSCMAGVDVCYLEANCTSSQPELGLVSGCRLDYTSSAGAVSKNVTQLSRTVAVSCDNQTISYTGTAYDSILGALGCPRTGVTKCPPPKECTALDTIINGTVQYNSAASLASGDFTGGTVATYSCADGYRVVGEDNRTCLLDGTWTGAEPQCRDFFQEDRQDCAHYVWYPLSITLMIYSTLSTAGIVILTLILWKITHQKGGHRAAVPSHSTKEEVALKENLCYGPVSPPPPRPPAATQTVSEYEEIAAPARGPL